MQPFGARPKKKTAPFSFQKYHPATRSLEQKQKAVEFSGGAGGGAVESRRRAGGSEWSGAGLGLGEALVVPVQTQVLHRHQFT